MKNEKEKLLENIKDIWKTIYPVGSIYMSVSSTSPTVLFGGTWEAWGTGKVPVGIDTSDTDFGTVEKTGGSKTTILTTEQMPSHTHTFTGVSHSHGLNSHTHTYNQSSTTSGSTTLTTSQIPSHSHATYGLGVSDNGTGAGYLSLQADGNLVWTTRSGGVWASGTSDTSASGYRTIAIGKNESTSTTSTGGGSGHTHSITRSSTSTGAASGNTTSATASGTNSNTGEGKGHSNLQPYVTCYMWKRTA